MLLSRLAQEQRVPEFVAELAAATTTISSELAETLIEIICPTSHQEWDYYAEQQRQRSLRDDCLLLRALLEHDGGKSVDVLCNKQIIIRNIHMLNGGGEPSLLLLRRVLATDGVDPDILYPEAVLAATRVGDVRTLEVLLEDARVNVDVALLMRVSTQVSLPIMTLLCDHLPPPTQLTPNDKQHLYGILTIISRGNAPLFCALLVNRHGHFAHDLTRKNLQRLLHDIFDFSPRYRLSKLGGLECATMVRAILADDRFSFDQWPEQFARLWALLQTMLKGSGGGWGRVGTEHILRALLDDGRAIATGQLEYYYAVTSSLWKADGFTDLNVATIQMLLEDGRIDPCLQHNNFMNQLFTVPNLTSASGCAAVVRLFLRDARVMVSFVLLEGTRARRYGWSSLCRDAVESLYPNAVTRSPNCWTKHTIAQWACTAGMNEALADTAASVDVAVAAAVAAAAEDRYAPDPGWAEWTPFQKSRHAQLSKRVARYHIELNHQVCAALNTPLGLFHSLIDSSSSSKVGEAGWGATDVSDLVGEYCGAPLAASKTLEQRADMARERARIYISSLRKNVRAINSLAPWKSGPITTYRMATRKRKAIQCTAPAVPKSPLAREWAAKLSLAAASSSSPSGGLKEGEMKRLKVLASLQRRLSFDQDAYNKKHASL